MERSTGAYMITIKPLNKATEKKVPFLDSLKEKFPFRILTVGSEDTDLSQ